MFENLPSHSSETSADQILAALPASSKPLNRLILLGSSDWVTGVIHRLHNLGFAEVGNWTRPMPTRNPNEVISLLHRPSRAKLSKKDN